MKNPPRKPSRILLKAAWPIKWLQNWKAKLEKRESMGLTRLAKHMKERKSLWSHFYDKNAQKGNSLQHDHWRPRKMAKMHRELPPGLFECLSSRRSVLDPQLWRSYCNTEEQPADVLHFNRREGPILQCFGASGSTGGRSTHEQVRLQKILDLCKCSISSFVNLLKL